jgi:hypothetical protein
MASLICNGCGGTFPAHHDTAHTQECAHHAHHTPTGWTACTHKGDCYTEAAA